MTHEPGRHRGSEPEPAAGPAEDLADELAQEAAVADGGLPEVDAVVEAEAAEEPVAAGLDVEQEGLDQAGADELALARMEAAERLVDLQRLQAEFVNYKRRVERDRELVKQNATYAALAPIVEILDTIDRAREHEPLAGGFKAVAEQLERSVSAAGLVKFGEPGDVFDPTLHEALSHLGEDPEVSVTTCKVVAKSGYRLGDRVVRAAQVLVADPPS